jgi:3-phosphoshikimate 1-carboxyvinyltransferase
VENRRELTGEPVADLRVRSASLKGITLPVDWIPRTIDELPILCVAAACATGETVIRGAGELRFKESDRIATMAGELKRLGVEVEEYPDGLRVSGGAFLKGGLLKSHGDHRVAMSLLVAGLVCEGETVVEETECIVTSFPGFMPLLSGLIVH